LEKNDAYFIIGVILSCW